MEISSRLHHVEAGSGVLLLSGNNNWRLFSNAAIEDDPVG